MDAVVAPRYRSLVYDSARWEGIELRPGDIVISTPPKCGTTWTQMICALLIFQEPELSAPLSTLSPWIDMVTEARTEMVARLEAQEHRRFVKTHTPLDGLPLDPRVTYLCVGRDPRDVAISMDHHMRNLDIPAVRRRRAEVAEIDGTDVPEMAPRPQPPADERDRFWRWVDDDRPVTDSGSTLRFTLHHQRSFWDAQDDLDVVLVHYDDLSRDLESEMRRLADHLHIAVPEQRWPSLVEAAGLVAMRSKASELVPGARGDHWHDPSAFFRSGSSEQWRDILDDEGLRRYAAAVCPLGPDDLLTWLHRPAL